MFRRHICSDEKDVERTLTGTLTQQVPSSIAPAAACGAGPPKTELTFVTSGEEDFNIISSSDSSNHSDSSSSSSGNDTGGDTSSESGGDTSSDINNASGGHGGGEAMARGTVRSDQERRKRFKQPLPSMYPSVQRLIPLSVKRLTEQFDWTPTPLVCS
eukprot:GHVS01077887.1.p2 GENE.GHVS01077887.1~~GHVS01077887.1.p2  ORF type:complete len:158 (+),score=38.05 GHVS01077887.1:87-560(+)